jgi:hypothetical protein
MARMLRALRPHRSHAPASCIKHAARAAQTLVPTPERGNYRFIPALGFSFDFHDDTDKLNPDYASACPADRKPQGGISFV